MTKHWKINPEKKISTSKILHGLFIDKMSWLKIMEKKFISHNTVNGQNVVVIEKPYNKQ